MDAVKSFNEELSGIYETKPPISRAKMTLLTKKAIKGIKFYKHIVQSMEKFVQKCRPEYKVPGLYVIDSVVRQSRHQFGPEKDVFMPRLCKNILNTFSHIYKCPAEDKPRVLRVLNLWQKNSVFPLEIVQQLTVMGGAPSVDEPQSSGTAAALPPAAEKSQAPDQANLTNILTNLLSNPDTKQIQNLAGLLSSSQQNQLEDLLHQVKGAEQFSTELDEFRSDYYNIQPTSKKSPSPPPPQANIKPHGGLQPQEQSNNRFSQAQAPSSQTKKPAFNREVLDFDYSDDEQTPPAKVAKQSHAIDPNLLAKLPTADQIQQLTGSNHNSAPRSDDAQRQRLEQEQEIFNQQLQEIEQQSKKSRSASRSDRGESHHRRKRSRSRSRSRDRHHRHHRKRSHSRDRHRSRRSRSREHSSRRSRRSRSRSTERRRDKKGFPPVKEGYVSVCTTTLWIGNIASKVMQHELQAMVEEYGKVASINMIPPRGCAYVCMENRQEADRALHKIKHQRLNGKSLKCDWAPSKEMPENQKETWEKDLGVNYVALTGDPKLLRSLSQWGSIDINSVPENRRDELAPEPEPVSEPEKATPPSQPQMIQSFNPAATVVPTPVPNMMPRAQMPVMVRPFQLNPFGMSQQMRIQQSAAVREPTPAPAPAAEPTADTSADMTVDSPGGGTPTADEKSEEPAATQSKPVAQFPAQYGAMPIAQGISGHVPVQLQMMPNMGQQFMQQRVGMMPIRMGIPMQLRPGWNPAMRVPMQGHPQMMANQPMRIPVQQQQMRPQMGGFPPQMRMAMPGQPPMRMAQPPTSGPPSQAGMDRETSPADGSAEQKQPEKFGSPPPENRRRGFHDAPGPMGFNRPRMNGPRGEFGRPPFNGPHRFPRPPRMMNRPPHDMMNRPPHSMVNMNRPPMGMDRAPRNEGPHSTNRDGPPDEMDRPARMMDRRPSDFDGPPMDTDRPSRDMDRPPRDTDRPPRDTDRPPRDMDRPPRDMDRPPRDMDRPPRDMDRSPRRDYDRGRRERSRDRDRRDRDMDRRGRDRDRDRDRRGRDRDGDRDRRDFGRGGRDFDRRDRGPPRGGRSFRGGREDRGGWGRGGPRGRGGRGGGRGRGRGPPEIDPEEEEYQRKRQETLRKRHEDEEEYAVEEIDFSAFGLPSGFGGPPIIGSMTAEHESTTRDESNDKDGSPRREADRSPRREQRRRDSEERSYRRDESPRPSEGDVHNKGNDTIDSQSRDVAPSKDADDVLEQRDDIPANNDVLPPDEVGSYRDDVPPAGDVDCYHADAPAAIDDVASANKPIPEQYDHADEPLERGGGREESINGGELSQAERGVEES